MMANPFDAYAVEALQTKGSIELTHDPQGRQLYCGHMVSVQVIKQKLEETGATVTFRHVIDGGSTTLKMSK